MSNIKTNKEIQKAFIKKAKKAGIRIYKNNIHNAKSLENVCGSIRTKHPASTRELIYGR